MAEFAGKFVTAETLDLQETLFIGAINSVLPGQHRSEFQPYLNEVIFDISLMVRLINAEYIDSNFEKPRSVDLYFTS